jgi:hypothetical protein
MRKEFGPAHKEIVAAQKEDVRNKFGEAPKESEVARRDRYAHKEFGGALEEEYAQKELRYAHKEFGDAYKDLDDAHKERDAHKEIGDAQKEEDARKEEGAHKDVAAAHKEFGNANKGEYSGYDENVEDAHKEGDVDKEEGAHKEFGDAHKEGDTHLEESTLHWLDNLVGNHAAPPAPPLHNGRPTTFTDAAVATGRPPVEKDVYCELTPHLPQMPQMLHRLPGPILLQKQVIRRLQAATMQAQQALVLVAQIPCLVQVAQG